jgi:hypothetical protein
MDFDNYNYSVNETTSGIKAAAYKRTFKEYNPTNKDKKEDIIEAKPTLTHSINNTHYLAVVENKYKNEDDDSDDDNVELTKSNLKNSVQKNDYITQFYIASLSVIGLYILFRYLHMKK